MSAFGASFEHLPICRVYRRLRKQFDRNVFIPRLWNAIFAMASHVEHFVLPPTPYVPNNKLPVIVYRDVLPKPHSEESTTAFLEANKWEKKVGPETRPW